MDIAWIALLGLIGVLSRYGVDQWLVGLNQEMPYSNFLINVLGSSLAGIFYVLAQNRGLSSGLYTALLVGFCGGFTTFSTYSLNSFMLLDKGKISYFLIYFLSMPFVCLLFASLPTYIFRYFSSK